MFVDKIAAKNKAVPCSDNIAQRKILEMAAYVTYHFGLKIVPVKAFAFQLDEIRHFKLTLKRDIDRNQTSS
jgi:hypothetical protein